MMEVMVERCAGIDVHKKTITVCTLVGSLKRSKPETQTKVFGTTTRELQACAQWLESPILSRADGKHGTILATGVEYSGTLWV